MSLKFKRFVVSFKNVNALSPQPEAEVTKETTKSQGQGFKSSWGTLSVLVNDVLTRDRYHQVRYSLRKLLRIAAYIWP